MLRPFEELEAEFRQIETRSRRQRRCVLAATWGADVLLYSVVAVKFHWPQWAAFLNGATVTAVVMGLDALFNQWSRRPAADPIQSEVIRRAWETGRTQTATVREDGRVEFEEQA